MACPYMPHERVEDRGIIRLFAEIRGSWNFVTLQAISPDLEGLMELPPTGRHEWYFEKAWPDSELKEILYCRLSVPPMFDQSLSENFLFGLAREKYESETLRISDDDRNAFKEYFRREKKRRIDSLADELKRLSGIVLDSLTPEQLAELSASKNRFAEQKERLEMLTLEQAWDNGEALRDEYLKERWCRDNGVDIEALDNDRERCVAWLLAHYRNASFMRLSDMSKHDFAYIPASSWDQRVFRLVHFKAIFGNGETVFLAGREVRVCTLNELRNRAATVKRKTTKYLSEKRAEVAKKNAAFPDKDRLIICNHCHPIRV